MICITCGQSQKISQKTKGYNFDREGQSLQQTNLSLSNSSASVWYPRSVNNYIVPRASEPSRQLLLLASAIFELGANQNLLHRAAKYILVGSVTIRLTI